jgi:hypothetical protein
VAFLCLSSSVFVISDTLGRLQAPTFLNRYRQLAPNYITATPKRRPAWAYFSARTDDDTPRGILHHLTETYGYNSSQQNAFLPSADRQFSALSYDPRLPAANPALANFVDPSRQPNLNSPSPFEFAATGGHPSTDNTAVISEAVPDPWIPDAQYAQARARRGGRRASERELSPIEEIRWMLFNHNLDVLRELDPHNRRLTYMSDPDWVPSERDNEALRSEIARVRGAREFERHHNLSSEFGPQFKACRLDPEDFITYVPRDLHRIRPNGLHTGTDNWNAMWRKYFAQRSEDELHTEQVLRQLLNMWERAPWLRR